MISLIHKPIWIWSKGRDGHVLILVSEPDESFPFLSYPRPFINAKLLKKVGQAAANIFYRKYFIKH